MNWTKTMGAGNFYSTLERDGLGAGFGIRANLDHPEDCEDIRIRESLALAIDAIDGDVRPSCGFRAAFDKQMIAVGEGLYYSAGFMGWQHDYVVQVGGTAQIHEYLSDTEWHERNIRDAYGMTPARFKTTMAEIFARLNRYLMLTVMLDHGLECHHLSGGWSAASYVRPSGAMIRAEIKRLRAWLRRRHRRDFRAPSRNARRS